MKLEKDTIKESLLYVVVGGMTTVVNFAVYFLCTRTLNINELASNAIAWFFAVLFAYFADKIVVFHKMDFKPSTLVKEMTTFYGMRLISGAMDMGLLAVFSTWLGISDVVVKIFSQVVVLVSNYIFSKFFIFKKKEIDKTPES